MFFISLGSVVTLSQLSGSMLMSCFLLLFVSHTSYWGGLHPIIDSVTKVTFTTIFHPFFLTHQYPYRYFLCHHVT